VTDWGMTEDLSSCFTFQYSGDASLEIEQPREVFHEREGLQCQLPFFLLSCATTTVLLFLLSGIEMRTNEKKHDE